MAAGKASKEKFMKFQHKGETLTINLTQYFDSNATAAMIVDAFGFPYASLSVNIPGESENLPEGAFFLKDYSENKDLAKSFLAQVPVEKVGVSTKFGYVVAEAYRIL